MKFKLDENFGSRTKNLFLTRGFDVETVAQEGLSGCADDVILAACASEKRCLVTLDLDFCDILRFPPAESAGIVVVRVPHNPTLTVLERLVDSFLELLANPLEDIALSGGSLWIVEPGRIRVRST